MKLAAIIKKDLKLILRSKISALIILFGPLLIMLIVGLAFNSSSQLRINIGYHVAEESNLTQKFINVLQKSNYVVKDYPSQELCKASISDGKNHICIIFPPDFVVANKEQNVIIFVVDNSKLNFFETVVDSIDWDFNQEALVLTEGMTQQLLNKLNQTQESVTAKFDTVIKLKEDNAALRMDVAKISQEISKMDLNFDYTSLGIDSLESQGRDLSRQYLSARKNAEDATREARSLISDMEDEIEDLNISASTKNDLYDMLNDSETYIDNIRKQLNATKSFDEEKISSSVGDLKKKVQSLQTKFATAASARDASAQKVLSINGKLNESLTKIQAVESTFNLIYSNIQSTEITDLESITRPVQKKVEPVVSEQNQLNFIFPYLVVLVIMFIGLLLSSTLIIMEKTSTAHFRNFVTPTRDTTFLFSTYLTTFLVISLQLVVVLMIFAFYFQRDVMTNIQATLIVLALTVTFFAWLGMAIGNLFNSEETGTLASISISSILLFISGLVVPLERLPAQVAYLAQHYNPFVVSTDMLRMTMIHWLPLTAFTEQLYVMLAYVAGIFLILLITHKLMKRSYLLQWGGYVARRKLRNELKIEDEMALLEKMKVTKNEDHFVTKDHKKISDLKGVLEHLKEISDDDFKEYINETHKVAEWVQDVLANDLLAYKLRKEKSRKKCIKLIEKGLEEYEKLRKKYPEKKE